MKEQSTHLSRYAWPRGSSGRNRENLPGRSKCCHLQPGVYSVFDRIMELLNTRVELTV